LVNLGVLDHIYFKNYENYFISLTSYLEKLSLARNIPQELEAKFNHKIMSAVNNLNLKQSDKDSYTGKTFEQAISFISKESKYQDNLFYTPKEISQLVAHLASTTHKKAKGIYDPACGTGSLLLNVSQKIDYKKIVAQEINQKMVYLARMNMLVHGMHPLNFDIQLGDVINDPQHLGTKFDVIVSNPPMGLKRKVNNTEKDERFNQLEIKSPKISIDIATILHMLYHLEEDGVMITIVPNGVLFRGGLEKQIRKHLIDKNLIDSIISLPANLLHNTGIPVSLLICKKNRKSNQEILFIDASGDDHFEKHRIKNFLRINDIDLITETYKKRNSKSHYSKLVTHKEIEDNDFNLNVTRYVDSSDAAKEIDYLAEQFGEFEFQRLEKIVKSIQIVGEEHVYSDSENVLFFPRQTISKIKFREEFKKVKTKSNYFEIEFNENMILSDYVAYFFESDLGQNILKTNSYGVTIQSITKDDLLNTVKIPVPSISIQKQVISAYQLMNRVKESITKIQKELSLSPNTANSASEKLHGTLESLNELSEEESILAEIRKGESRTLEFKESFSLDVRNYEKKKGYNPKKEKYIEHSSLKNVAGFINSKGGTLIIGVDDDGKVIGLEKELKLFHKNSTDKLLLHFKNLAKSKIGPSFYSHFNSSIKEVNNKIVMIVKCKKSETEPCFYDDEKFYVRNSPSTDELSIKDATKYIRDNFKN
jgi:type I restriction system adenine methylase HsdM